MGDIMTIMARRPRPGKRGPGPVSLLCRMAMRLKVIWTNTWRVPLVLGVGVLCLDLTTLWGCAEECNGCTDINISPTPDPGRTPTVGFVQSHPHTWAMLRQIYQQVLVYAAPPLITETRWYDQYSWGYFLVTWEDQPDGTVLHTEKLCYADLSVLTVATTRGVQEEDIEVPQALIDRLPSQTWTGRFEEEGQPGDPTYSLRFGLEDSAFGPLYTVWGATLENPVEDTCPLEAGAPEFDQDEDGFPGVTTTILVEEKAFTDTYICQRMLFRQGKGAVEVEDEGAQIGGDLTDVLTDQTQFGASNPLFPTEDPEVRWNETESFYRMIALDDGADCAAVTTALEPLVPAQ